VKRDIDLVLPASLHERLQSHLFPGDDDEHAAVLLAGVVRTDRGVRLLARELMLAKEGQDYRSSSRCYKALQPTFIHRAITRCRDQRLAYLAIHNHGGDGSVAFSTVDLNSHERGYPALLDIAEGMPVGGLVVAQGAMEIDLWLGNGDRCALREARILGRSTRYRYANERVRRTLFKTQTSQEAFDRQVLLFGEVGQAQLRRARVAIVGLGGVGSLVNEYLARLGVGELILIDPDRLERSNLSRVVGGRASDEGRFKVTIADEVAAAAPTPPRVVEIASDLALESVAVQLRDVDYIFLAADSMRARLVFNALVQQYFIPGVQLGSKVRVNVRSGELEQSYSVVRGVLPGIGCLLCNGLIDATALAAEWHSDEVRPQADYGTALPNPSVITLNAVAAAHGVNEFLHNFLGLRTGTDKAPYLRFDHLTGLTAYDQPRRDVECPECGTSTGSRYGRGDDVKLPCVIGIPSAGGDRDQ
jgi:hypothetical protein